MKAAFLLLCCLSAVLACTPGDKYGVTWNCSIYRECKSYGLWATVTCPAGEHFDVDEKVCKLIGEAKCETNGRAREMKEEKPAQHEVECVEGEVAAVAGDCSKYTVCQEGHLEQKSCHFWQRFDTKTHECRIRFRATC